MAVCQDKTAHENTASFARNQQSGGKFLIVFGKVVGAYGIEP